MGAFRYPAFISYSHADETAAIRLHRALERYRIPRQLVGRGSALGPVPRRLFPIFRDRDELGSSGELGTAIEDALRESSSLIVLCSPAAAASRWVNQEILQFKKMGREDRILCLLLDGEPNDPERECFPPAARFRLDDHGRLSDRPAEPLAADMRPGRDNERAATLRLIAGILGIGLDRLRQRDAQARSQRWQMIASASSLIAWLMLVLAVLAFQARNEAQEQRDIAQTRQQQAERLIQFMLGDLRERLEEIGKLGILDSVGDEAMAYFAAIDSNELSDADLMARATALRQIGDVRVRQGQLDRASPAFREALALDIGFLRRHPEDAQALFNASQSQFYVGYDLFLRGDHAGAQPWFEAYLESAEGLIGLEPGNPRWRSEKHYALDTLATNALRQGQFALCMEQARQALTAAESAGDPGALNTRLTLGQTRTKLAICAWHAGDLDTQVSLLSQNRSEFSQLLASEPDNAKYRFQLASARHGLAKGLLEQGRLDQANAEIQSALGLYGELQQLDPSNIKWESFRLDAMSFQVELALLAGDVIQASALLGRAIAAWSRLDGAAYDEGDSAQSRLGLMNLRLAMSIGGQIPLPPAQATVTVRQELEALREPDKATVPAEQLLACLLLAEAGASPPTHCRAILTKPLDGLGARRDEIAEAMRRWQQDGPADLATARALWLHDAQWHLFSQRCACVVPFPTQGGS